MKIMTLENDKLWNRGASTEKEKEHEKSTKKFAEKMGNDYANIHAAAIFEKYLREELFEKMKVPMLEEDISKIIGLVNRGPDEPKERELITIDGGIDYWKKGSGRTIFHPASRASPSHKGLRTFEKQFLRRYPLEALETAIRVAQERANREIQTIKRERKLKKDRELLDVTNRMIDTVDRTRPFEL